MDCNATKRGVDNLDKLVTGFSCKRRTLHWPLVIFLNILDISAYNTFVMDVMDGVQPRLEQREAPEETALSRGAGQGIGKT